jgi:transposase
MRTPQGRLARAAFRYHYLLPPGMASALGSVFTAWRRSDRHDGLTEVAMRTLIERCCGLDVHQATIVACLLVGKPGGKVRKEIRSFATTTAGLLQLRDWLVQEGCTDVGMESTGVYWRPVYALLEDDFTLVVGNAQRIKNVPGRKTDVKDCEWIADLLRHGLIPPSFVPERPIRALRDLMRFRRSLVDARTNCRNRIIQVLESANIKLANVASDVFGVSGMAMLKALVAGNKTPREIADLAKGVLRKKLERLELALQGSMTDDHRFMLDELLKSLAQDDQRIAAAEQRINEKLKPYLKEHRLLTTIPGVDWAGAAAMIGEHGINLAAFATVERFAAWSGAAPGNNQSGGRNRRARARKGNVHLKTVLCTAAVSAGKTKSGYLREKYHRIKARSGAKIAAGAVAHKISIAVYHILTTGQPYRDLGGDYLDKRSERRTKKHLLQRLERMGYAVTLTPKPTHAEAPSYARG